MRKAMVVLLAFALAGCSVGDIRRPAPTPTAAPPPPPPASAAPTTPRGPDEVRANEFALGRGYTLHTVEFGDRDHGYAMFLGCDQASPPKTGCPAALFGTTDGGRSWNRLKHPREVAGNHQMYVRGNTLILFTETDGWYFSTDGGATFRHEGPSTETPYAYNEAFGRYQSCCDADDRRRVVEYAGGRMRPVPSQPPIPDVGPVAATGATLYAAGLTDGRPRAAVSSDRGRTWRETTVAGGVDGLDMLQLLVSSGGEHVWLMGTRSRFGFPSLWLYDGQGWRPSGTTGHPLEYLSAAALDDGSVAITGPSGAGVVAGGSYRATDWPVGDGWIFGLPDGTIFSEADGAVWLGVGNGTDRRWIKVVLSAR